ncbi:MAG: C-terminal binding protein [Caldisericia bacterium]|nr:C-terminal binding protein [Caldisericia bacterium]MDD4615059.1 C-terminal binding protein [Caldisericia bacterium]
MGKFKVFMTDKTWPDLEIEKRILSSIDAELVLSKGGTPEEICQEGRDCDALMVLFTPMNRKNLEFFSKCKVLIRMGIGINTVDMEAATEKSIMVANVPDYCQDEVADHTIALLLEITRKVGLLDNQVKSGGWNMDIANPVPRLQGKVFGLFGCGGIGIRTGRRAASFGMKVAGYDPFLPDDIFLKEEIKKYTNFEEFISEVDVLSLHVPLTSETHGVIDNKTLNIMKTDAYLINSSRGPLINEDALFEALENGTIAGAALDVLCEEPPKNLPRLAKAKNIVITPHAAWNSIEAIPELRVKAAEEVVRTFLEGKPKNLINREVLAASY